MFRLFFMTFYYDGEKKAEAHGHDDHAAGHSSIAMTGVQVVLAIGAVVAGFVPFGQFVSSDGFELPTHIDISFSILPVALSLGGILLAMFFFYKKSDKAIRISEGLGSVFVTLKHKFYIDEIYAFVTKKIIFNLIAAPAAWIDKNIVDGMMNTFAKATEVFSFSLSGWQSGKVQSYAAWFLAGVLSLVLISLYLLQLL